MNFRHCLSSTILLAVCLSALHAQDATEKTKKVTKPIDPSGTWRWKYDMQGQEVKDHAVLQIGKEGKITGLMYSSTREEPLKTKGKMDGDKLVFSTVADFGGTLVDLEFSGRVKGDELVGGNVTLESDQGSMDLPWSPKRSVELPDVVGKWNFVFALPSGETEGRLVVAGKDKKYSAKYSSDPLDRAEVERLKVEKNILSFRIVGEAGGREIVGEIEGRPYGNTMKGMLDLDYGADPVEIPFVAKRQVPKKKAARAKD